MLALEGRPRLAAAGELGLERSPALGRRTRRGIIARSLHGGELLPRFAQLGLEWRPVLDSPALDGRNALDDGGALEAGTLQLGAEHRGLGGRRLCSRLRLDCLVALCKHLHCVASRECVEDGGAASGGRQEGGRLRTLEARVKGLVAREEGRGLTRQIIEGRRHRPFGSRLLD